MTSTPSLPAPKGVTLTPAPVSYALIEDLCRRAFGFRLFTVLAFHPEAGEVRRIYSSQPAAYPVGGRKKMGPTPWGELVLDRGQAWLGNGAEDIRWAFPDAEQILALGCEACACAPITADGRIIGVLSISDAADSYSIGDVQALSALAGLLADPLMAEAARA